MRKMWGVMIQLSQNMWKEKAVKMDFDEEAWEKILEACAKAKLNTILLDVGDGVCFGSHPELEIEGAWSRQRVHKEVQRARNLGIAIIPKLNFSAYHDHWLGEYGKMVSTETYYKVCRDLIHEVYDMFEQPEYIHLGMDEEDAVHTPYEPLSICRTGVQLWHDLQYLFDCVRETGATPWIWSDFYMNDPEGFRENLGCEQMLLSPWYYNAIREEHYSLFEEHPYPYYFGYGPYKMMEKIKYVEDDPYLVKYRQVMLPGAKDGYKFVPCPSDVFHSPYCTQDLVEYFHDGAPDESIVGYLTAPWVRTKVDKLEAIFEAIDLLVEARAKYYPDEA